MLAASAGVVVSGGKGRDVIHSLGVDLADRLRNKYVSEEGPGKTQR